ncbi:hypothetical protein P3X46_014034 [Hevea brasiliensis]|uniref:Uncharacterized protein n=1 Tax=Hevea brasiliensis TaxID=3981 RepID=A0ABQ9M5G8_HEVBR|nr:uncharacterized protein LOC110653519 [Hevea brasiliensis]KAJ9175484.1 hypothetical protein P3X46_014034 [Hevea brasiliensis]
MEDHCSPLSLAYFYQDEGIEELRYCLLYITELEATIFSAKEEIERREVEMVHLKDLLSKAIEERNEAQVECQKLMSEKIALQQLVLKKQKEPQNLQIQQQLLLKEEIQNLKRETPPPLSGSSSSENGDSHNHIAPLGPCKIIVSSQFSDPIHQQPVPEVIQKLAADRPLPEKGKLLQAVKEAGPLLQTLLLAGPLPQWQHPPPQLDSIEIPPVTISPAARLIYQDSFNNLSACLSKKRGLDLCESGPDSSSPKTKHQKLALH